MIRLGNLPVVWLRCKKSRIWSHLGCPWWNAPSFICQRIFEGVLQEIMTINSVISVFRLDFHWSLLAPSSSTCSFPYNKAWTTPRFVSFGVKFKFCDEHLLLLISPISPPSFRPSLLNSPSPCSSLSLPSPCCSLSLPLPLFLLPSPFFSPPPSPPQCCCCLRGLTLSLVFPANKWDHVLFPFSGVRWRVPCWPIRASLFKICYWKAHAEWFQCVCEPWQLVWMYIR